MALTGLKVPLSLVIAALGVGAGSGGTVLVNSSQIAETKEKVEEVKTRVLTVEKEAQQSRERAIRIETIVERIERKVDKL
jgi:uncharacterized protein HemX